MSGFLVTFFADMSASSKTEERLDLAALAHRIRRTSGPEKQALPWLKLSVFGERRTKENSLRSNTNVLACSGAEADYDGEAVGFEDAVQTMRDAGVVAIVYPSPSHSPARPRWRVLCPFLTPCPPAERARFLARLNGLFGGAFSPESWTLSQSFYYGAIKRNPAHRVVEITTGIHLD